MKKADTVTDSATLHKTLEQLASRAGTGNRHAKIRQELIAVFKTALHTGRTRCEDMLLTENNGRLCARRLCQLTDTIITALYDFVTDHLYPLTTPSRGEHIALIAVGGYGRGMLAPGSDIDLMFLLPWKQTPWSEQVMEYILYMLWDCGLKVGHATRNSDETIRIARNDMTVRTALLEMRFLVGDRTLFNELSKRFETEIVCGTAPEFIHAKLAERDRRLKKSGETCYLVEPNVKESKGGQRDLQTLFWITRYHYHIKSPEQLVKHGVLSHQEAGIFQKADDFLWAVRCHMHFLAGKAQEQLTFDIQREIASRLGYTNHPGLKDVERFMKHYFLVAKQVGDLTRIICAALEEEHAKAAPSLKQTSRNVSRHKGKIHGTCDFVIETHRITTTSSQVFKHDPVNLIRLFHLADRHGLELHPHALQQATRSLRLINAALRENKTANALFLDILTSPHNPALILRRMNETGILGRFIPDFGRIVAMMQFNLYHHYTVDEHLLRCIDHLSCIEKGKASKEHPLANSLIRLFKCKRRILYTATFLHDIAKGRPEHHALAGEKIARRLCPRLGLGSAETETVAWLVREHLTMNMVAQSRDLNDRKTIADFANIVQTVDRLQLLLVLTICDIKGVGPDVWNGWKGQLLRTLYYETELMLNGGFSQIPHTERLETAKEALSIKLADWNETARNTYLDLHHPNYWLTVAPDNQLHHARFIADADRQNKTLAITAKPLDFEAVTEITILAPDHPRLLSIITGACAAAGANIVDAQIFTTTDGRALDLILVNRAFELDEDEQRRVIRIGRMIEDTLAGKIRLPDVIATKTGHKRASNTFERTPRVELNNDFSDKFSVIEVKGLDRPGLLTELTTVISDLSLDIASAHINTFGEKVIDSFYVTDLTGYKITNPQHQRIIKHKLLAVFGKDTAKVSGRKQ